MQINEFARRTEIQVLAAFVVLTVGGYYFWLKKQKEELNWVKK